MGFSFKRLSILLGFLILLLSIPATIYLVGQRQELRKKAEEIQAVTCDGQNDQTKIMAAINALPASGGTVTLPARQCTLTGSINIARNDVVLEGQGTTTILFLADNTNRDVITASNRSNLHIRNLTINGNKVHQTPQVGIGIKFDQVARSSIEGVIVKETGFHGIRIGNSAEAPEFVIRDVQTINTGMMGIVVTGAPRDLTIANSTTLNTSDVGIFVRINGVAQRVRVEGNTVQNPKGPGISIAGESGSLDVLWIIGNTVSGMHDTNGAFGIWIPGPVNDNNEKHILNNRVLANGPGVTGGDHFGLRGNNGELVGNTAEGGWADGFALGARVLGEQRGWTIKNNRAVNNDAQGFMTYLLRNSNISNNFASGNDGDGIYIRGGKDNVIENNEVRNNGYGIALRDGLEPTPSGSLRNLVRGNRVYNNGQGIIETGMADYNTFTCNDVTNNDIRLIGPNSRIVPCVGPTPTPTPTPRPTATPTLRPTATPTPTPIPTQPPLVGDIDRDGDVDIYDYNILVSHFGPRMPPGGSPADLDHDGDVDIYDYNLLVSNFGRRI